MRLNAKQIVQLNLNSIKILKYVLVSFTFEKYDS
jgi:hypothetical protein